MKDKGYKGRDSSLATNVPILAASLSLNILALLMPITVLLIFDRVIPFQSVETLRMLTLFLLVSVSIELALRWSRATLLNITSERAAVSNYRRFLSRILHANPIAFSKHAGSAYLERFAAIAHLRDHNAGQNQALMIDLPFTLAFAAMIALIGGWLVFVPIIGLIAVTLFSLTIKRAQWRLFDKRKALDSRRYAFLSEVLSGGQTVKANRMERQMTRRFEKLEDKTVDVSEHLIRLSGLAQNFGAVFGQVSLAAMGLLGAYLVIQNKIGIAEMAACMLLNGRIIQPLTKLLTLWVQSENIAFSQSKLSEIDALEAVPAAPENKLPINGRIAIQGLKFSQDRANSAVLNNLQILPGQIALVSSSARWQIDAFYDAVAGRTEQDIGEVLIDGTDARSLASWRGRDAIVVLERNPAILSGTLLQNLSGFGDDEQITRAKEFTHQLRLDLRINRLPMGYNTVLGSGSTFEDDPVNRQLIALVRVLALRPKILIMSEPTSVLDTTERDAFASCLAKMPNRPTILVDSPDPRLQRLADVTCSVTSQTGDEVADWNAELRTDQIAAQFRMDVA